MHLVILCAKIEFVWHLQGLEKSDGNLWNKRPLPDELLWALTEELNSLHNSVYPLMFRYAT